MSHSLFALTCFVLSTGCGASEEGKPRVPANQFGNVAGNSGSGGAGGAGGGFSNPSALCTVGSVACYCPDGAMSGTQFCDARHELGACQCASSGGGATGAQTDAASVCEDLRGLDDCDARSFASAQVPASILFVIDRSGSMACNAPPVQTVEACNADPQRASASDPSRWEITVGALKDAFGALNGSNGTVGLSMFSTDGSCGVDSTPIVGLGAVDAAQEGALATALDTATPAGGTPIVGAVILAYHHLHEELRATGNRYVVLITDGEESCGTLGLEEDADDLRMARQRLLTTEVQKAREANIRTFVIGAPGSEGARGFLSELAFLGGTARTDACAHGDAESDAGDCHFDLTSQADFAATLRQTLGEVSGQALACELPTPPGASALTVNVQMSNGGAAPDCIVRDQAACESANGWQFPLGPDGVEDVSRVVLCGDACARLKGDPSTVVDVVMGCFPLE
jgi:hypothetical protein